jgi:hypothetical protein
MVKSIALVSFVGLLAPLFAMTEPGVELLADRLSVDALVSSEAHWWQVEERGLTSIGFTIDRVRALVGLTGSLNSIATLRASCDISVLQPQDLYVNLEWPSGFGVRAGQFKLPVGVDQMTNPEQTKFVNGSLLAAYARPVDVRDVGLSGTWTQDRVGVVLAVIDGNGPNTGDNNDRKDFCGRVVVSPWCGSGIEFAGRGYYGWPDPAKAAWRTVAVEVIMERKRLSLRAELQNLESAERHNSAGYLQLAYDIGVFEPACRVDLVLPRNEKAQFMATGGVNFNPLGDRLKFMLDGSYFGNLQGGSGATVILMRLQAAL